MNIKRAFSITKRIFNGFMQEKQTLGLIFIAPIFAMFLFGLAFSGDVQDVPVVIVNKDKGLFLPAVGDMYFSSSIISNLDKKVLKITYMTNEAEAYMRVSNGLAHAAIVFPETLSEDLYLSISDPTYDGASKIIIRADKTSVNMFATVLKSFSDAMLDSMEASGKQLPVSVSTDDAIYGKNAKFMDFLVPGVMGFASFFLTALLTILAFIGERRNGTLERLLISPLKESEIVLGYVMAFGIIGIIQSAILISTAVFCFGIHIEGNVLIAFLVVVLLAITSLSLGILLSSLAASELQAIQFLPLLVLPTFLLAGIFWPVEAIPFWLRPLSYIIPPYYGVDACRSVMIRGWGLDRIWFDLLMLALFAVLFIFLASKKLKDVKNH